MKTLHFTNQQQNFLLGSDTNLYHFSKMVLIGHIPRVAVGIATGAAAKSAGSQPYAENCGGVLRERVMQEHVNTHPFASLINRDVRPKTLILGGEVGAAVSSGM